MEVCSAQVLSCGVLCRPAGEGWLGWHGAAQGSPLTARWLHPEVVNATPPSGSRGGKDTSKACWGRAVASHWKSLYSILLVSLYCPHCYTLTGLFSCVLSSKISGLNCPMLNWVLRQIDSVFKVCGIMLCGWKISEVAVNTSLWLQPRYRAIWPESINAASPLGTLAVWDIPLTQLCSF